MKIGFYVTIGILCFFCLNLACSKKNVIEKKPESPEEEEPQQPTPPPASDTESWVYLKNKHTGEDEKFFGIGIWHVPGYPLTPTSSPDGSEAIALYKKQTAPCNIVFMDERYIKPHMSEKIQMVSNFSNTVHGYLNTVVFLPKGADKDYYRSQYLKANVNNPQFVSALDDAVGYLIHTYKDFNRVYAPIDEIALGGVSKWFIPPAVGEKIYERIKMKENDLIVFVDLLGHGRGSTFFFEQNYLKKNSVMPGNPPYDLLGAGAQANKEFPLLGFSQSYNEIPVYKFDNAGNYSYNESGIATMKSVWYENVKQVAAAYANNGNVFSINAFRDFWANPVLAGVTVDALKAGLGDKPIWVYFDGNGYAKPASVSPQTYVNDLRCQIYTTIIHGATGVFFWNDWSKTPEVYNALLPALKVLNDDLPIIKLNTAERFANGDLHWMMKVDNRGRKYIIMTNTSKTSKLPVNIAGLNKKDLNPLEVFVSPL